MSTDEVQVNIETTEELAVAVETGHGCRWRSVIKYVIPVCVLTPLYAIVFGTYIYFGLTTEPDE